jgi:hypothetical protein
MDDEYEYRRTASVPLVLTVLVGLVIVLVAVVVLVRP